MRRPPWVWQRSGPNEGTAWPVRTSPSRLRARGCAAAKTSLQVVHGDQRVDLGGRHRGMPEQLLDHADVGAALQEVRGEGVAQRVRRDVARHPGPVGGLDQHRPGGLARQPPSAGVEEQGARALRRAHRGELRAPAGEVGVDGGQGVGPHRDQPLLAALAAQQHGAVHPVEVVDVEAHGLGDAGPGAVEDLQQGAVAERQGGAGRPGGLEDRLDVGQGQRLRQPPGRRRGSHRRRGVVHGQPVGDAEPVEAAHRHDGPARPRSRTTAGARRLPRAAGRGTPRPSPRSPRRGRRSRDSSRNAAYRRRSRRYDDKVFAASPRSTARWSR